MYFARSCTTQSCTVQSCTTRDTPQSCTKEHCKVPAESTTLRTPHHTQHYTEQTTQQQQTKHCSIVQLKKQTLVCNLLDARVYLCVYCNTAHFIVCTEILQYCNTAILQYTKYTCVEFTALKSSLHNVL